MTFAEQLLRLFESMEEPNFQTFVKVLLELAVIRYTTKRKNLELNNKYWYKDPTYIVEFQDGSKISVNVETQELKVAAK